MDFRKRYYQAHEYWFKRNYPYGYADGHLTLPVFPQVETSNGLTKFILMYMKWSGHHAERSGNMGRPVERKIPKFNIFSGKVEYRSGGIQWLKGSGTKGTSDIKAHIKSTNHQFPIPCYIEVKIGKDFQSDDQIAYEYSVTSNGGLYLIAKKPDDFLSFYDYVLTL